MDKKITGMMIYYNEVCKKKLWYFIHDITMESENEDVNLGRIIDEQSYEREAKHINIDNVINIDFIKENKVLNEVKKSRKIEKAGIWQLKYYIWYLEKRGTIGIVGRIDYPLLKKSIEVKLEKIDREVLIKKLEEIEKIGDMELPPVESKKAICKKCAYFDLCRI